MTTYNEAIKGLTDEQIERELAHEQKMISEGVDRYWQRATKERQRGDLSSSGGGRLITSRLVLPLAEMITEELSALESGKAKRKPPEIKTLKLLPPKTLAAITIKAVLDVVGTSTITDCTIQRLGFRVGGAVSAEVQATEFRKNERHLFDNIVMKINQRTSSPEQRSKELVAMFQRIGGVDPMTETEKARLGALLVTLAERLGVIECEQFIKGKRTVRYYVLSNSTTAIIAKMDEKMEGLEPYLMPMLIPPQPWSDLKTGGYWLPFNGLRMLTAKNRGNGINRATRADMPRVFDSVNFLQSVPFQVNRKVLEVVEQMTERGLSCKTLPAFKMEELPPRPHDIETNEEARAEWRLKARDVHTRNATLKGKVIGCQRTVLAAQSVRDEEVIYFPKCLDFRGRVYDMPLFLKPQGDDLSKGLLHFATGKEIGESGIYWLAVHGANVWGEDKCSFDDRYAWVEANETRILKCAEDPLANRFWMDADKPFQFLAFCFEWSGVWREGAAFKSRLPVALDGSCNGIQHLSAILRDSVGGAAVNLLPSGRPNDIYSEVMEKVKEELEVRKQAGGPTAQKWLQIIERKTVKRPVMTLPYGATRQGFCDQIYEDALKPLSKKGECPFDNPRQAAKYLGEITWEATGEVVIAARAAMDWLQAVAQVAAKSGNPIEWTTPSGFVVRQDYRSIRKRRLEVISKGQRITLQIADGVADNIDTRKMMSSIAPNFVHAMDAAHMLRTVEQLIDTVGPTLHLSMVHDSYATHACDVDNLASAIRESFVQVYQEKNWLEAFRDEVTAQLTPEEAEKIPPIPPFGDLEITEVLNSLYFFG